MTRVNGFTVPLCSSDGSEVAEVYYYRANGSRVDTCIYGFKNPNPFAIRLINFLNVEEGQPPVKKIVLKWTLLSQEERNAGLMEVEAYVVPDSAAVNQSSVRVSHEGEERSEQLDEEGRGVEKVMIVFGKFIPKKLLSSIVRFNCDR